MGFQLFESSGTFNPSDWGLKAGDIISIICVGGGGGGGAGCTDQTAGKTGSASSFGSILSAAGGSGGAVGGTPGTVGAYYGSAESENNQGGCGAGGWYPGVIYCGGNGISQSIKGLTIYSSAGVPSTCISVGGGGTGSQLQTSALPGTKGSINGIGADGGTPKKDYSRPGSGGGGGAGYGAGGGSAVYNSYPISGANSGEIKKITYKLTSTDSIAITVGAGGAAITADGCKGGSGAPGCVCVFW